MLLEQALWRNYMYVFYRESWEFTLRPERVKL